MYHLSLLWPDIVSHKAKVIRSFLMPELFLLSSELYIFRPIFKYNIQIWNKESINHSFNLWLWLDCVSCSAGMKKHSCRYRYTSFVLFFPHWCYPEGYICHSEACLHCLSIRDFYPSQRRLLEGEGRLQPIWKTVFLREVVSVSWEVIVILTQFAIQRWEYIPLNYRPIYLNP